jgi:hypothetical protein
MSVRRTGGGRKGSSPVSGTGKSSSATPVQGGDEASSADSTASNSIRAGAAELIKKLNRTGGAGFDRHRQELAQGVVKYFGEMLEDDPEMFKKMISRYGDEDEGS